MSQALMQTSDYWRYYCCLALRSVCSLTEYSNCDMIRLWSRCDSTDLRQRKSFSKPENSNSSQPMMNLTSTANCIGLKHRSCLRYDGRRDLIPLCGTVGDNSHIHNSARGNNSSNCHRNMDYSATDCRNRNGMANASANSMDTPSQNSYSFRSTNCSQNGMKDRNATGQNN